MGDVNQVNIVQNYCKYDNVKAQLLHELKTEQRARTIADKLGISIHTFHKYKNYAQLEAQKIFMTLDEKIFQEKQRNASLKRSAQKQVVQKSQPVQTEKHAASSVRTEDSPAPATDKPEEAKS